MELTDKFSRTIILTDERWKHITDNHPEIKNLLKELQGTLEEPDIVKTSINNKDVVLFYKLYEHIYNGNYMCVVVKPNDELIITAYITDRIKRGEIEWKKN